ncbi:MAG: DMT family transporter [Pseudomonadota bacterium]
MATPYERQRDTGAASTTNVIGILCVVGGMATTTLNDALIKSLSAEFALYQIVFLRGAVALPLVAALVLVTTGTDGFRSRQPLLQLARALLIVGANAAFFASLAALPLADALATFFVAPLLITLLSVPVLGERLGPWRIAGTLIGLLGVVVILQPGSAAFQPAALLPLAAAFCYALMQLLTRRLGTTDRASTMTFYGQLGHVITGALMGLWLGDGRFAGSDDPSLAFVLRPWVWPDASESATLVACAVLIAAGSWLLAEAYRCAEANAAAPFEYTALPIAVLWGWLVFGEWPGPMAWLGMVLIGGGGLLVLWRESRSARRHRTNSVPSHVPPPG